MLYEQETVVNHYSQYQQQHQQDYHRAPAQTSPPGSSISKGKHNQRKEDRHKGDTTEVGYLTLIRKMQRQGSLTDGHGGSKKGRKGSGNAQERLEGGQGGQLDFSSQLERVRSQYQQKLLFEKEQKLNELFEKTRRKYRSCPTNMQAGTLKSYYNDDNSSTASMTSLNDNSHSHRRTQKIGTLRQFFKERHERNGKNLPPINVHYKQLRQNSCDSLAAMASSNSQQCNPDIPSASNSNLFKKKESTKLTSRKIQRNGTYNAKEKLESSDQPETPSPLGNDDIEEMKPDKNVFFEKFREVAGSKTTPSKNSSLKKSLLAKINQKAKRKSDIRSENAGGDEARGHREEADEVHQEPVRIKIGKDRRKSRGSEKSRGKDVYSSQPQPKYEPHLYQDEEILDESEKEQYSEPEEIEMSVERIKEAEQDNSRKRLEKLKSLKSMSLKSASKRNKKTEWVDDADMEDEKQPLEREISDLYDIELPYYEEYKKQRENSFENSSFLLKEEYSNKTEDSQPNPVNVMAKAKEVTKVRDVTQKAQESPGNAKVIEVSVSSKTATHGMTNTTAPPLADEEYQEVPLSPCKICGRNFAENRMAAHLKVCRKFTNKKRKKFDESKMRKQGTDMASYKTPSTKEIKALRKTNWREKHESFIESMRAAKQYANEGR
eukprot:Nk52_evm13s288 gene=Nk52_evmTU13s288